MLRKMYLIFLLAAPCIMVAAKLSPADSLRRKLPALHGQAKLDALIDMTDLVANGNSEKEELKYINEYIAEAIRQNKPGKAAHATANKISILECYGDRKQMEAEKDDMLSYMRDKQCWKDYYDGWSIIATMYSIGNMIMTAAREAREMYEDAQKRNSKYGLGLACYVTGHIYFAQGDIPQAAKVYERAVNYLKASGSEASMLLSVYSDYADILDSQENYKKMAKIVAEWKNTIDKLKADDPQYERNMMFYNSRYNQCYVSMAKLAMNTGRMAEAGALFDKAEKLIVGVSPALSDLLYGKTLYYRVKGDYKSALSTCRRCKKVMEIIGDNLGLIGVGELESELLISMGRPAEAAYIYQKLLPQKDSLYNAQSRMQLSELNTLYKLDELKMQKDRMRYIVIAVAVCGILIVLILTLYIIHLRKLRAKNRIIYEKMKAEIADEAEMMKEQKRIPEEELSADERLYRRICEEVQTKELFKNPEMNREAGHELCLYWLGYQSLRRRYQRTGISEPTTAAILREAADRETRDECGGDWRPVGLQHTLFLLPPVPGQVRHVSHGIPEGGDSETKGLVEVMRVIVSSQYQSLMNMKYPVEIQNFEKIRSKSVNNPIVQSAGL